MSDEVEEAFKLADSGVLVTSLNPGCVEARCGASIARRQDALIVFAAALRESRKELSVAKGVLSEARPALKKAEDELKECRKDLEHEKQNTLYDNKDFRRRLDTAEHNESVYKSRAEKAETDLKECREEKERGRKFGMECNELLQSELFTLKEEVKNLTGERDKERKQFSEALKHLRGERQAAQEEKNKVGAKVEELEKEQVLLKRDVKQNFNECQRRSAKLSSRDNQIKKALHRLMAPLGAANRERVAMAHIMDAIEILQMDKNTNSKVISKVEGTCEGDRKPDTSGQV